MALTKKLTRIGNSMGIVLPADLLDMVGIGENQEVSLSLKGDGILLKPVRLKDHKIMKTFMSVLEDYNNTFKKLAKKSKASKLKKKLKK